MAAKPPEFELADRNSATWAKLKKHMEARLVLLRARNDGDHDERKTNRLRGGIAELNYLMSLGDEKPLPPPEDALFKD